MPTDFTFRKYDLVDGNRQGIELYIRSDFQFGHFFDPRFKRFLESDNAARDMPTRSGVGIVPPCQQRAARFILDQEIYVYERGCAADIVEEILRQTLRGFGDRFQESSDGCVGIQVVRLDSLGSVLLAHVCFEFFPIQEWPEVFHGHRDHCAIFLLLRRDPGGRDLIR